MQESHIYFKTEKKIQQGKEREKSIWIWIKTQSVKETNFLYPFGTWIKRESITKNPPFSWEIKETEQVEMNRKIDTLLRLKRINCQRERIDGFWRKQVKPKLIKTKTY